MADEQQTNYTRTWGMPRGLYQTVKYYGVPVVKAGFVAMSFIGSLQMSGTIFPADQPIQFLTCVALITILALYLILPTNAGGTNAMAVFYFHFKRKKKYLSIDRNAYPEVENKRMKRRRLIGRYR